MANVVPFSGVVRQTAFNKPALIIDISPSDMHGGSWAVLSCCEHSGYCECLLDGIFSMDDAISAAKRIAKEKGLRISDGLSGGDAA